MSINNRTSTNDNRQLHDDTKKQYSHQTTNVTTKSKKSNQQHHVSGSHDDDECDAIGELIGKYGKYQFYMTFLLSLFQIPNTFHISSPIYQVSTGHQALDPLPNQ